MTHMRIKGVKILKDRHGRMRCHHRATANKIGLTEAPLGSAEFLAKCETIRATAVAQKQKGPRTVTLGGVIKGYFETGHFANLAEAARQDYRKCADFLAPSGTRHFM